MLARRILYQVGTEGCMAEPDSQVLFDRLNKHLGHLSSGLKPNMRYSINVCISVCVLGTVVIDFYSRAIQF